MSSRRGGGSGANESSSKGKNVSQISDRWADLADVMANTSLDSQQDGGWEEVARKPRNRSGGNAGRPYVPQNPSQNVMGNPWAGKGPANAWAAKGPVNAFAAAAGDSRRPAGRVNTWNQPSYRGFENNGNQLAAIPPPLENGWEWRGKMSQGAKEDIVRASYANDPSDDKDDDKEDFNDDDLDDSDYDSDESQKSHETRKKHTLLKGFFETLDNLKLEEINEPERQWHCPACHGGPGAIDWYRGLQPLMTHAKTKGTTRVKVHRELAQLLDEELRRRGTSVIPAGEAFGKWKGLNENAGRDKEIVWPPMVVIMNTQLDKDDNGKWLGMGNAELLEYFNAYDAVKARHSYGPQGHRGMSLLIFEASAVGFLEADRLSKHLEEEGTDRDAWDRRRVLFLPGGQRQLYGYMAEKADLDIFNQHSQGKSKLKFEMRSYQEMFVSQMKKMNEDNQLLNWYKNKVLKEKKHSKALEASFGAVSEKLRKTLEENRIVRQRTKLHHEQNKEEMDYQEEFFKEQIRLVHEARDEKEENFEKLQQEKRQLMKQYMESPSAEDRESRIQEGTTLILSQQQEMDKFAEERDKLVKALEERKAELKKHRYEEDMQLEKEFDAQLARLMEKYNPQM